MVPQEVVLFLTLEVVPKLTLERPKSGTKTNSPAYTYIYIYMGETSAGRQKSQFSTVKIGQENPSTKKAGVVHVSKFIILSFVCLLLP